jgi:phage repressor protein C with HTH and peptisase S24 domain
MKAINRLYKYLEYKGVKPTNYEREIGLSSGYLSNMKKRDADLGEKTLNKVILNDPQLSSEWLIAGKGAMLKTKAYLQDKKPIDLISESNKGYIPLVEPEALGGFGNNDFSIKRTDIVENYFIPEFEDSSFIIRVRGNSMSPRYISGDMVACKILKESQFIQWNEIHVISTIEQGILIKKIKEGRNKDYLTAISENPEFPKFEIPKNEITGLAIVLGGIRLE